MLKLAPAVSRPFPSALISTVAELRKLAADVRVGALTRLRAVEKLLLLEGLDVPRRGDATEALIDSVLGTSPPVREEGSYPQRLRRANRSAALEDITRMFKEDLGNGLFRTVNDVVLRLPEHPPVAQVEPDTGLPKEKAAAIAEALTRFRGGTQQ
jgi:hypothetical protein